MTNDRISQRLSNHAPTALITGASAGLGEALTVELARRGWTLIIDARGQRRLATSAATLRAHGSPQVMAVPGDVVDAAHRDQLVAAAHRTGGIDLLVHNASTCGEP